MPALAESRSPGTHALQTWKTEHLWKWKGLSFGITEKPFVGWNRNIQVIGFTLLPPVMIPPAFNVRWTVGIRIHRKTGKCFESKPAGRWMDAHPPSYKRARFPPCTPGTETQYRVMAESFAPEPGFQGSSLTGWLHGSHKSCLPPLWKERITEILHKVVMKVIWANACKAFGTWPE